MTCFRESEDDKSHILRSMSDTGFVLEEPHLQDKSPGNLPANIYTVNNVIHVLKNSRVWAFDSFDMSLFHFLIQPFSVHAREKIALSTPPAELPAPKRVKTFVTSLHLVAPCDLRDVLVQTAQYCMTGNALSPGAVLVRWEGSTTSLDQLLWRTVKDGEHAFLES